MTEVASTTWPTIYISHRPQDKPLADKIRSLMRSWTNDQVLIGQTSDDAGQPVVRGGHKPELDAHLVILLLVEPDEAWAYCMYECGVAVDPKTEKSTIAAFRLNQDFPFRLEDKRRVTLELDEIEKFVADFHRAEDFFPRLGRALDPDISDDVLHTRSEQLHKGLEEIYQELHPGDATSQPLSVFISHSQKERPIADILRAAVQNWSNEQIRVFQFSDNKKGLTPGDPQDAALLRELAEAHLLLLICPTPDETSHYCLFECGVVSNPASPPTRIAVLELGDGAPKPLEHLVRVKFDRNGIRKFTEDFHRNADFFPRLGRPFAKDVSDELIEKRANALYDELARIVPPSPHSKKAVRRWHRLTLAVDSDCARSIQQTAKEEQTACNPEALLREHCLLVYASKESLRHFGMARFREEIAIEEIFYAWQREVGEPYASHDWLSELRHKIVRVVRNQPAIEVNVPLKSADQEIWYLPVIESYEIQADPSRWLFTVGLFRIPSDGEYIKITTESEPRLLPVRRPEEPSEQVREG